MEMRRPISPKSKACPEGRGVYAARMSVEVGAHYPGRPRSLPIRATVAERWREGERGVSRGHSRCNDTLKARRKNGAYCRSDR